MLDLEYESRVLSYIFNLMEEQNWDVIHVKESKKILRSLVPSFIIDHILSHFAECKDEGKF